MRRDEHALADALHEGANALPRASPGVTTSSSLRGEPWQKRTGPRPVTSTDGLLDEGREPGAGLRRVLLEQPGLPLGRLVALVEERPVGVAADEDRRHREAADERERLLGLRPPGQVAAEHDEVRSERYELRQDRLERDGVRVDVGERRRRDRRSRVYVSWRVRLGISATTRKG